MNQMMTNLWFIHKKQGKPTDPLIIMMQEVPKLRTQETRDEPELIELEQTGKLKRERKLKLKTKGGLNQINDGELR